LAHTTDLLFYPTPTQCTLKKKRKKNRSGPNSHRIISLSREGSDTRFSVQFPGFYASYEHGGNWSMISKAIGKYARKE